jgi:hypothetical protein
MAQSAPVLIRSLRFVEREDARAGAAESSPGLWHCINLFFVLCGEEECSMREHAVTLAPVLLPTLVALMESLQHEVLVSKVMRCVTRLLLACPAEEQLVRSKQDTHALL